MRALRVEQSQGKERVVGLLGPGSFVGEGCLGGQPVYLASARASTEATLVRVETDHGVTGIGSGDLMIGFAGHEELFIGQDPLAIERHYRILANINFHYGRCWPLDLALWDLAGKLLGQPCWRLLGGLSNRVRAYASSGTLRKPAQLAEAAEAYLQQGFPALKIRFHRGDWREDIAALAAVRKAVGDKLALMVDCNQGWRMPWDTAQPWSFKDALEVARQLEALDVYWMEEPLHRGDYDGMVALRQAARIRIAGGEMTRELHEFRTLIQRSEAFTYNLLNNLAIRLRTMDQTFVLELDRNAEAAKNKLDKLRLLLEASKIVNSTVEIDKLLGLVLSAASRSIGADRGTLYLIIDPAAIP